MNQQQIRENAADFRAISLPYVLQKQEDGSYLVLNRKYKPIGFLTDEWVHYEKYPIAHHFVRLSEETIGGDIYLYDDDGLLGEAGNPHEAQRVLSGCERGETAFLVLPSSGKQKKQKKDAAPPDASREWGTREAGEYFFILDPTPGPNFSLEGRFTTPIPDEKGENARKNPMIIDF